MIVILLSQFSLLALDEWLRRYDVPGDRTRAWNMWKLKILLCEVNQAETLSSSKNTHKSPPMGMFPTLI